MRDSGVLEVDQVSKRYGNHDALHQVSLSVAPGEVCGLLGPNGAGKTTLVSIIAGLRSADGGRVTVAGIDVATGGRAAREAVGLASQETSIYPTVSVRENLDLFARLAGYTGRGIAARIDEVADIVELTFDGPPPRIDLPGAVTDRDTVRIPSDRPAATAAALLAGLGTAAERLVTVELGRPSLETVFLAVTGRAYRPDDGAAADDAPSADTDPVLVNVLDVEVDQ